MKSLLLAGLLTAVLAAQTTPRTETTETLTYDVAAVTGADAIELKQAEADFAAASRKLQSVKDRIGTQSGGGATVTSETPSGGRCTVSTSTQVWGEAWVLKTTRRRCTEPIR